MIVQGVQLDYKLNKDNSVKFHQKMFGRIANRVGKNKRYSYYIPGILDTIPHEKIYSGRIIVGTLQDVDYGQILPYCSSFKASTVSKDSNELSLSTSREKWKRLSREKGYSVTWDDE